MIKMVGDKKRQNFEVGKELPDPEEYDAIKVAVAETSNYMRTRRNGSSLTDINRGYKGCTNGYDVVTALLTEGAINNLQDEVSGDRRFQDGSEYFILLTGKKFEIKCQGDGDRANDGIPFHEAVRKCIATGDVYKLVPKTKFNRAGVYSGEC